VPTIPDFASGIAASLDLGDGGPHDPQIRFTADDKSCRWNGFPVCIDVEQFVPIIPTNPAPSFQVSQFVTTPGAGSSAPTEAQWPGVQLYDYLKGLLSGYNLQYRMRFDALVGGGTSVGSAAVQSQIGGCSPAQPGPILGHFDTGVTPVDFTCQTCSTAPENAALTMVFSNFSPIAGSAIVANGRLDITWHFVGGTIPTYTPNQKFSVVFQPPGCVGPRDPGLYITLETTSCGLLTKTYQNIADAVNALNLGITASILGGHGADTAKPDPACGAPDYCCDMSGAECSGSIHYP
jgi:hypothetical protein